MRPRHPRLAGPSSPTSHYRTAPTGRGSGRASSSQAVGSAHGPTGPADCPQRACAGTPHTQRSPSRRHADCVQPSPPRTGLVGATVPAREPEPPEGGGAEQFVYEPPSVSPCRYTVLIAMEGPKGVGKTATARRRARTTILLDQPTERALLEADPERPAREPAALLHDTRTSTRVRVGSSECAYGR